MYDVRENCRWVGLAKCRGESFQSPGDRPDRWTETLSYQDIDLDAFQRNEIKSIPVSFVPLAGAAMQLKNPKVYPG